MQLLHPFFLMLPDLWYIIWFYLLLSLFHSIQICCRLHLHRLITSSLFSRGTITNLLFNINFNSYCGCLRVVVAVLWLGQLVSPFPSVRVTLPNKTVIKCGGISLAKVPQQVQEERWVRMQPKYWRILLIALNFISIILRVYPQICFNRESASIENFLIKEIIFKLILKCPFLKSRVS